MFRIQGNYTKRMEQLIENDHLGRRLHDLHREKADGRRARNTCHQASGEGVVDAPAIKRLLDLRLCPVLIGRWFPGRRSAARGARRWTTEAAAAISLFPGSRPIAATLPHSRHVRLSVCRSRHRGRCGFPGRRLLCRRNAGPNQHEQNSGKPFHGATAEILPPSPVPAGGPKKSFFPSLKVTSLECPQFVPSRALQPNTVIVSPGRSVTSLFQPVRYNTLGGKPSNFQFSTAPLLFVTSR